MALWDLPLEGLRAVLSDVPFLCHISVALEDLVCPPSTVYAAYNAYSGLKEIAVYPDNGHEGGGAAHQARQHRGLRDAL